MEFENGMENGSVTLNLPDDASTEHTRQEGSNLERNIETQEKRTRFSLSHDEGISLLILNTDSCNDLIFGNNFANYKTQINSYGICCISAKNIILTVKYNAI